MSKYESPLVSIIIPNYNYGQYIAEAIDSALNQTYQPVEVIVVDDGSTDNSRDIINSYGQTIKAIFQTNHGPSVARNAGIAISKGDYIIFLDADDVLLPDAAQHLWQGFLADPQCGVIFGTAVLIDTHSNFTAMHTNEVRYFSYEEFLFKNYILTPEAMVKKEILNEIGYFNPNILQCEDYDLWLRIAQKNVIKHIDKTVVQVQKHAASFSANTIRLLTWERYVILYHANQSCLSRRAVADVCHRLAYQCRIVRQTKLFRQYTIESIKYNPLYWKNYAYLLYSWFMQLQP